MLSIITQHAFSDLGSRASSTGTVVAGFATAGGSGTSLLSRPTSIFLDANRTLYILDNLNYRVQMWIHSQPIGITVAGGRGSGTSLTMLSSAYGLYIDNQSVIYVSEYGNSRVTKWYNSSIGVLVSSIAFRTNLISKGSFFICRLGCWQWYGWNRYESIT